MLLQLLLLDVKAEALRAKMDKKIGALQIGGSSSTKFSRAILGGGSQVTELSQGYVNPTSPNVARTYAIIAALHFFRIPISCCIFQTRAAQS